MVMNAHELKWDDELLSMLNIPKCMLPEIKPSVGIFGYTDPEWFGAEIPITGIAGDQSAALFDRLVSRKAQQRIHTEQVQYH